MTFFVRWQRKAATWFQASKSFAVPRSARRGHGQTLFGAINNKNGRFVYYVGLATSISDFKAFLETTLIPELPQRARYQRKPILVLDNHSSHKNKEVLSIMRRHFRVVFTPCYSCCFNRCVAFRFSSLDHQDLFLCSIETVWALVRNRYLRRITHLALKRDYG